MRGFKPGEPLSQRERSICQEILRDSGGFPWGLARIPSHDRAMPPCAALVFGSIITFLADLHMLRSNLEVPHFGKTRHREIQRWSLSFAKCWQCDSRGPEGRLVRKHPFFQWTSRDFKEQSPGCSCGVVGWRNRHILHHLTSSYMRKHFDFQLSLVSQEFPIKQFTNSHHFS